MPPSADAIAPEMRLLIWCARMEMPAGLAGRIRELAAGKIDWADLLSKAAENSITPLLDFQLRAVAPDAIEPCQMQQLHAAVRANALRCLKLTGKLIEILKAFHAGRILAIPYTGPVLAAQAYGDVSFREFGDVDIILRQYDMAKAHEVMLRLGYRARFPESLSPASSASLIPDEYKYYDEANDVIAELHTERTLRHFPVTPDLDEMYERSKPVSLSSHEVRTFCPEDTLIAICIHGSKDFWERMMWVVDVAELIRSNPEIDWRAVSRWAESLRAQRMLRLGLILAARVCDAPLPPEIVSQLEKDAVAQAAASGLERRLLARASAPLGAAARFHFRRRMVPGFFAGWGYAMRLTLAPAEEDWMMIRLPRFLSPIYVLLRPLRLLQKYGASRRRANQVP